MKSRKETLRTGRGIEGLIRYKVPGRERRRERSERKFHGQELEGGVVSASYLVELLG